jgi:hypothetical protein
MTVQTNFDLIISVDVHESGSPQLMEEVHFTGLDDLLVDDASTVGSYSEDDDSSIESFELIECNSSICDSIRMLLAHDSKPLQAIVSSSTKRRRALHSPQMLLVEAEDDQDSIVRTRSRARGYQRSDAWDEDSKYLNLNRMTYNSQRRPQQQDDGSLLATPSSFYADITLPLPPEEQEE